jgi:hypothetical protein
LHTLKEEHRLKIFENRVLWKIFGPKRDEVTGEWKRLHNQELHALYPLPNITAEIKLRMSHVAHVKERRDAYTVLVGKPEGRKSLGKPMSRYRDNIQIGLQEVGLGGGGGV